MDTSSNFSFHMGQFDSVHLEKKGTLDYNYASRTNYVCELKYHCIFVKLKMTQVKLILYPGRKGQCSKSQFLVYVHLPFYNRHKYNGKTFQHRPHNTFYNIHNNFSYIHPKYNKNKYQYSFFNLFSEKIIFWVLI